ncbi:hypothetical protein JCM9533A_05810 [Catenuloplanes niger JCM 9533]
MAARAVAARAVAGAAAVAWRMRRRRVGLRGVWRGHPGTGREEPPGDDRCPREHARRDHAGSGKIAPIVLIFAGPEGLNERGRTPANGDGSTQSHRALAKATLKRHPVGCSLSSASGGGNGRREGDEWRPSVVRIRCGRG